MSPVYYRIVRDEFCGYEVQSWRWWFPFWTQCPGRCGNECNTHVSIERAEAWALHIHCRRRVLVVKYLGDMT